MFHILQIITSTTATLHEKHHQAAREEKDEKRPDVTSRA
jgi:hypothetical protein